MELHSWKFAKRLTLKRFFLNVKGLFDTSVVSLTKKEYGSVVHSLQILMKSSVLISDE